jgi:hypothetical protein
MRDQPVRGRDGFARHRVEKPTEKRVPFAFGAVEGRASTKFSTNVL